MTKLKSTYADGLLQGDAPRRTGAHPLPDDRHRHRAVSAPRSRICRTSPPAPSWAARCAGCSWPAEGNVLVDADYSQIELRLLAHMAGDEAMQRGLPVRRGLPHRHGRPGVPCAGERGHPRDALPRQGGELRHRVRHLRLLPQPGHRRDGGGGQGVYGALLRHLPRREAVHGPTSWSRPRSRAMWRPCTTAAGRCRS